MPETFETAWRRAHLEIPQVPPLLVRAWAQEGYSKLCDSWGWGFLRAEGTLVIRAARTVTVVLTNGSTTVTSAGLFTAADNGRQIRVGRLPVYTVTFVDVNTLLLDRAYTEDSVTGLATIFDAYAILPADFRRFLQIYDRYYLRTIPFWMTENEIALADPGRVFSDQGPRYLIAQAYSAGGQVRYEYWPSPTSARTYPFLYIRRADQLTDSTVLPGVFSERADLLRTYCLMRGALWPGTAAQKNVAFNPPAAQAYKAEWDAERQQLELRDDDEYPQQLMLINWARRLGAIAPTATLLRQTDATLNDYY